MLIPARRALPEQITRAALFEERVRKLLHLDERTVFRIAPEMLKAIERHLVDEIRGFGYFVVKERRARKGRNPMMNKVIDVMRRCTVRFKAGKHLTTREGRTN